MLLHNLPIRWCGGGKVHLRARHCDMAHQVWNLRSIRTHRSAPRVELGDCVHLIWGQLGSNRAHLFIDVVLPHALGERRELALDIGRFLSSQ